MFGFDNEYWGAKKNDPIYKRWPKNAAGEPEEPVLLCHCDSTNFSDQLKVNMLEAYGIPCLRVFPGDGEFGRLILGMSGQGCHILVPASLYEDAAELCKEENNDGPEEL